MRHLEILGSETGSEGARSPAEPMGARHKFRHSANPRVTSCARCGRRESDSVHAFLDVAQQAAVRAHLDRAGIAASAGDLIEAVREAQVAIRLAEEN